MPTSVNVKTEKEKTEKEKTEKVKSDKPKSPKKQILFNILEILRKYSDENHRLSQVQIDEYLQKNYEMKIDRKTIRSSLDELGRIGFELHYSEVNRPALDKKTGQMEDTMIRSDYYLVRDFEDSELRLLIDSLLFSRHIPYNQCRELVKKLEGLSNIYFQSRVKHIATMPHNRSNNRQLFYTIDVLDEAISKGKKVSFKYLEYHTDKRLRAKKKEDGEERIYVVNPYQMAAKEGKYYLICNYDKYDSISNYRVDRIADIDILDERVKPFEALQGSGGRRLDLEKYMNEHIYMYSSAPARVTLRIVNAMVSDVLDLFGSDVTFREQDDTHVTVSVLANESSVVQFAQNFAPDVIVTGPESVRQKVASRLREAAAAYE